MHTTTFTVIITTYNRQHLLPRAIKSVLDQTFPDFELLVIDNGSTDETPSVVRGIRDDRVRYVRNPRPTGSCDGPRNLGIGMAKGRFVAFLDDDDIWYPERLEKVKRAFDEHPDVSCVCHNEMRNVSGTLDRVLRYGPWTADLYERLIYEGNCLSSCATTIKAEAVRQFNGFDEREEYSEVADYDLWIRMAREGVKVFFIEEPLGEFSLTGKNWSVVNPFFEAKQASMVKGHILRHEGVPLLKVSKRGMRKLFQLYFIAGRSFAKAGRFAHAAKWFLKAALFLVRRPSLVFDPRPRQRYV
jgi:glycosyltransferase involved in cell wall biosynthesis